MITYGTPYPPHKGYQMIALEQIKRMQQNNISISLFCIINDYKNIDKYENQYIKYVDNVKYYFLSKKKMILNSLKTLFNFKPFQVNMFNDNQIKKMMNIDMDYIDPDIVHIQTSRLALYYNGGRFKVLDMVDLLSFNMLNRAKREKWYLKTVYYFEHLLMKQYEKNIIPKFDSIILVSESESSKIKIKHDNIVINPIASNISSLNKYEYQSKSKDNIMVFHGNMGYYPNNEAMLYFINYLWQDVLKIYPDYKLLIVGKNPSKELMKYNNINNIIITGYVDDVSIYLQKAKIGIYPLNSGSGMQTKILEALSVGLPSIATVYATNGLQNLGNDTIIVVEKYKDILDNIRLLTENDVIRKKLSENGHKFISKNYSWDKNFEVLLKIYKNKEKEK